MLRRDHYPSLYQHTRKPCSAVSASADGFSRGEFHHAALTNQSASLYSGRIVNCRSIAKVLAAESDQGDIAELVRRMTFNTLIGDGDMHLNNWSLLYPDRINAALAPAYDFVSTVPYIRNESAALNVSRSKAFGTFTEDELKHFAGKAALSEKLVLDTARDTVERLRGAGKKSAASCRTASRICACLSAQATSQDASGSALTAQLG